MCAAFASGLLLCRLAGALEAYWRLRGQAQEQLIWMMGNIVHSLKMETLCLYQVTVKEMASE